MLPFPHLTDRRPDGILNGKNIPCFYSFTAAHTGYKMPFMATRIAFALSLLALCSCFKKDIHIHTDLPREAVAELDAVVRGAVPRAHVFWTTGAAASIAGKETADIVAVMDPLWYETKKRAKQLLPYKSPAAAAFLEGMKDPDGAYAAMRMSILLVAYNPAMIKQSALPESWKDLLKPSFKNLVSMGNPLESPATLAAISVLSEKFGWDFFSGLRRNGIVAAQTESEVLARIESGERPVGILLAEHIADAAMRRAPVRPIHPREGVIPVPGYVAIMSTTRHPEAAQKVYDWLFSTGAQNILARTTGQHSPNPRMVPHDALRTLKEMLPYFTGWTTTATPQLLDNAEHLRAKFSEIVMH